MRVVSNNQMGVEVHLISSGCSGESAGRADHLIADSAHVDH
jgi:hypothetical protein